MFRKIGIARRVQLLLLLVVAMPTLILGLLFYREGQLRLAARRREALLDILRQRCVSIEAKLRSCRNELETLASSPVLTEYSLTRKYGLDTESSQARVRAEGFFSRLLSRHDLYTSLVFVDRGSRECISLPPNGPGAELRALALENPKQPSPYFIEMASGPCYVFSKEVPRSVIHSRDEPRGDSVGRLYLAIDGKILFRPLHEPSKDFSMCRWWLFDQQQLRSSSKEACPPPKPLSGDLGATEAALLSKALSPLDYGTHRFSNAYFVLLEVGAGESSEILADFTSRALVGMLLSLFLGLLLVTTLTTRLTRPLDELRELSQSIAEGELPEKTSIPATVDPSVQRLWETFQDMTARLRERRREIEKHLESLNIKQDTLVRAEKDAAMTSLVAGIAHELNNPIEGVMFSSSLLRLHLDPPEEGDPEKMKEHIDLISEHLQHASVIISDLRDYARDSESISEQSTLDEIVRSALTLLQHETKDRELSLDLNSSLSIECAPVKLKQVVINLVRNAVQATTREDPIEVITEDGESALDGVPSLVLTVRDHGMGMDEDCRHRAFDPFFSTADEGEGTGLGLSVVAGIVKAHGGRISLSSTPGEGSTFVIELPAI